MTSIMKEFYSDPEAVTSAVHKFMNITVDEINNTKNVNILFKAMTTEIMTTEGLDNNLLGKMNYTDLITMLEMSKDSKYDSKYVSKYTNFSGEICTSDDYNLFIYKLLLKIILEAANNAIPIRLFLELPLQAFYAYMESVVKKGVKGQRMENNYAYITKEMEWLHGGFGEDTSIKELLLKVREEVLRPWGIIDRTINEYKKMVLDELLLAKRVLALTFMETFPERFTVFEGDD